MTSLEESLSRIASACERIAGVVERTFDDSNECRPGPPTLTTILREYLRSRTLRPKPHRQEY